MQSGKTGSTVRPVCIKGLPCFDSAGYRFLYPVCKTAYFIFNNPVIVDYGKWLLISQVALFPAFGLCYMMTITYQTIGASGYGLFLSLLRQGLFYVPFIIILPKLLGVNGIYLSQPLSDILTTLVCIFSIKKMKSLASENMQKIQAQ